MISVSIVTYHTAHDELRTCLDCLRRCEEIVSIEIVDNSSDTTICQFIKDHYPEVLYTTNSNTGYGAGNNISIRKSLENRGIDRLKYHLVMNSDIAFKPDVVKILLSKLEKDSSIGLIMPAVVGADDKPQSCCHPLPSPWDLIKHRFAPKRVFKKWRRYYDIFPQLYKEDINVPYMHGCFMLFRLDALQKVGLFDERFFMYPEDIDITRRVHREYKTIVTPDATIYHLHRAESRHSFKMLYIHAVNMLRYFAKWGFFVDRERSKMNRKLRDELKRR